MQPSPAEIMAYFRLDPETGKIYVRNPRTKLYLTRAVGKLETDGYIRIKYKGKLYSAGPIVWVLTHGKWPENKIDHKDRNKQNNRPSNLRDVSAFVNELNKEGNPCFHSGFQGIRQAPSGRYQVERDGKYLGTVSLLETAKKVWENNIPLTKKYMNKSEI